jgi:hypothetical protein
VPLAASKTNARLGLAFTVLASFAVLFIPVAKAGFGGGLEMLDTRCAYWRSGRKTPSAFCCRCCVPVMLFTLFLLAKIAHGELGISAARRRRLGG